MKTKFLHILLLFFLTLAVSDYVWIELFEDEKIVSEIETEKEKECEEVEKSKGKEDQLDIIHSNWINTSNQLSLKNQLTGFVKHGNTFCQESKGNSPKLFILHQQLRLHC